MFESYSDQPTPKTTLSNIKSYLPAIFFLINHLVFTQTIRIDNCMGASIAHLAERSAVNRKVVGSSPTGSVWFDSSMVEHCHPKDKYVCSIHTQIISQDSVVVITSVLHAEGRGFKPHS